MAARLADAQATLLLDGCDHLLDACAALADAIVRRCPAVRILATAREPLGVSDETVWRTPPLDTPASDDAAADALAQVASVRLFVRRARLVAPDFAATRRNARTVARLCRQLDGIPLAIEVAAAALRLFSVEQLADRAEELILLSPTPVRARPARHQSLRAAIDGSYRRLTPPEQALFRRLAVFSGAFSFQAAANVGNKSAATAAGLLSRLVDRSLVLPSEEHGAVRFRLLGPVRWYAAEQLAVTGGAGEARDAHLRHFVEFAERAARGTTEATPEDWFRRTDQELDNLRAALSWATDERPGTPEQPARTEPGLRLAASLGRYWYGRGLVEEGTRWLSRAMARAHPDAIPAVRATALAWQGGLAISNGRPEEALPILQAAVLTARRAGDAPALALALRQLGAALDGLGQEGAREALEEAGLVARDNGLRYELSRAEIILARHLVNAGDSGAARRRYEEALDLGRRAGEASTVSFACLGLGHLLWASGDTTRAEVLFREGLALYMRPGSRMAAAHALALAGLALQRRAPDAADRLRVALLAARDAAYAPPLAAGLVYASRLVGDRGDAAVATRLLAAVAAWRPRDTVEARDRIVGWYLAPYAVREAPSAALASEAPDPSAAALRALLGADAFARAWTAGALLTLDAAAQQALASLSSGQDAGTADGDALTAREREVAALVVRGYGTRDIAATLVISVGTVRTHVERILKKLRLHSRVQLSAWALGHLPDAQSE